MQSSVLPNLIQFCWIRELTKEQREKNFILLQNNDDSFMLISSGFSDTVNDRHVGWCSFGSLWKQMKFHEALRSSPYYRAITNLQCWKVNFEFCEWKQHRSKFSWGLRNDRRPTLIKFKSISCSTRWIPSRIPCIVLRFASNMLRRRSVYTFSQLPTEGRRRRRASTRNETLDPSSVCLLYAMENSFS